MLRDRPVGGRDAADTTAAPTTAAAASAAASAATAATAWAAGASATRSPPSARRAGLGVERTERLLLVGIYNR